MAFTHPKPVLLDETAPLYLPPLDRDLWLAATMLAWISPQAARVQEAIWAVQESRQALVSGSTGALAAQPREAEMSEDDVKAVLDRWLLFLCQLNGLSQRKTSTFHTC